jgi:putative ATP-dependent endonuclease of the OLD family
VKNLDGVMRDQKAKPLLAQKAFPKMTAALIQARDPQGEVIGWFQRIGEMAG